MAELTTMARWDELHRNPRHWLQYPSEHVVRWLSGMPKPISKIGISQALDMGPLRALDIGCGNGRHMRLLRDCGFDAFGIEPGLSCVARQGVFTGDMTAVPFDSDYFYVALAWGVFYYGTPGDADMAVREMHRVLKSGGRGLVSVRSRRDWRADHIDSADVFRCDGEPEDGMLLDFISADELEEIYGVFGSVSYEIAEWTTHDRDRLNSDWIIQVQK